MSHPFFKDIRSLLAYLSLWVTMMAGQALMLTLFFGISFDVAIVDGAIFNLIYMVLGASVWYTVVASKGKKTLFNQIINQITSASGITLIWYFSSTAILRSIFSGHEEYLEFLSYSTPWRVVSGVMIYLIILLLCYLLLYVEREQDRARNEARMREALRTAELDMLKTQINPHFLFNSLNSISSLTLSDPSRAQQMVVMLSDFLRYSVSESKEQLSTLGREMENVLRYIEIEKVRFGEKLQYTEDICPGCYDHMLPAMILQPLFENAVKHGVYESTGKVTIHTRARMEEDVLVIEIGNNIEPGSISRKGAGIGLKNVRERLQLVYRNEQLLFSEKKDDYFTARVSIPAEPYRY